MRLWNAISLACVYFSGRGYAESRKIAVNSDSFNESVQETLFSKRDASGYYDDDSAEQAYDFRELLPYLTLIKYANGTVPEDLQLDSEALFTFTMPAVSSFEVELRVTAQVNFCSGATGASTVYRQCANNANYAGNTYAITGAGFYSFLDVKASQEPSEIHCAVARDNVPPGDWMATEINCAGSECLMAEGETVKNIGDLTLSGVSC